MSNATQATDAIEAPKGYNGWSNYETWNCALWLSNEEWSQTHLVSAAEDMMSDHDYDADEATNALAGEIKDIVEEAAPSLPASMYSDILGAALQEIDYHEIARSYVDEVEIPEEEEDDETL